jgi:uncharacterized protein (TIGR02147 family)
MAELDFRNFLVDGLKQRQAKNPTYSMRAFARDLGISPQKLNQVLTGKSGLSPQSAQSIAEKLALRKAESDVFMALVESKHHRSRFARIAAQERVENLKNWSGFQTIDPGELRSMSEWYHWAAYVLVDLDDFRPDFDWISKKLGISAPLAAKAYDDLFALGLIREEAPGKWVRDASKFRVRTDQPSEHLRNYYRQLWEIANKALDAEPESRRDFSATMLSIGLDDIEFVKEECDAFHKSLIDKISKRPGRAEAVYALAVQFFPIALSPEENPVERQPEEVTGT